MCPIRTTAQPYSSAILPSLDITGRNVPIAEIARATGKNPQFIRIGLQRGILPFGIAMKNEGSSEYTYYCSDKLVWEATGYFNDKVVLDG